MFLYTPSNTDAQVELMVSEVNLIQDQFGEYFIEAVMIIDQPAKIKFRIEYVNQSNKNKIIDIPEIYGLKKGRNECRIKVLELPDYLKSIKKVNLAFSESDRENYQYLMDISETVRQYTKSASLKTPSNSLMNSSTPSDENQPVEKLPEELADTSKPIEQSYVENKYSQQIYSIVPSKMTVYITKINGVRVENEKAKLSMKKGTLCKLLIVVELDNYITSFEAIVQYKLDYDANYQGLGKININAEKVERSISFDWEETSSIYLRLISGKPNLAGTAHVMIEKKPSFFKPFIYFSYTIIALSILFGIYIVYRKLKLRIGLRKIHQEIQEMFHNVIFELQEAVKVTSYEGYISDLESLKKVNEVIKAIDITNPDFMYDESLKALIAWSIDFYRKKFEYPQSPREDIWKALVNVMWNVLGVITIYQTGVPFRNEEHSLSADSTVSEGIVKRVVKPGFKVSVSASYGKKGMILEKALVEI